jgi:radical SAM protein with 4Fe4S-binding SPASM domain
MQFHRVHIEVTNICGLACSFCPPKLQASKTMDLDFFKRVIEQLPSFTKELAFHVMGDPMILTNLKEYLDIAKEYSFEVALTSSGYYLKKNDFKTLFHPCVRQINISLNSYNKNSLNLSFNDYMAEVLKLCSYKLEHHSKPFINLRLWNMDEACSEASFNRELFEKLSDYFEIDLDLDQLYKERPKSIRLAAKVLLHFDSYFEWPSMDSNHNTQGTCYGLKSHIGVLADGTVVPCCLDGERVINLGNVHDHSINDILQSSRAIAMREGFEKGLAVEEFCQKCSYKDRFAK